MKFKHLKMYLKIALTIAENGTCNRAKIGAVIVKNSCIIGTGYNGAPRGLPHCIDEGCIIQHNHCIRASHAEENALINAARSGISTLNAIMFTTHSPCYYCFKLCLNAGIKEIYYIHVYEDKLRERTVDFLKFPMTQISLEEIKTKLYRSQNDRERI